jgi:hypothetical protein
MRAIALAAVLLLAACTTYSLEQRQAYLGQFVGHDEADVVRVLGVPPRTYEASGHRFIAYIEQRTDVVPGWYGPGWYGPWGGPGPWGGGLPPEVIQRVCVTTFAIDAGKVTSFSLQGNACG